MCRPNALCSSFAVALSLLWLGCGRTIDRSSERSAAATDIERSLEQQLEAVARGLTTSVRVENQSVDSEGWRKLASVPQLREIIADGGRLTDPDCLQLVELTNLRHLRARLSPITDSGLQAISRISSLQVLNLPQAEISDQGLDALQDLQSLVQLRLGSPRLTAGCCNRLSKLTGLKYLHLIAVPVDDRGLEQLAHLPNLQSLYLDGSAVTAAGWSTFYAARPDVHVHVDQRHRDEDPQRHAHPGTPPPR
jgi:Leucine-rich repeat (LRR) protein